MLINPSIRLVNERVDISTSCMLSSSEVIFKGNPPVPVLGILAITLAFHVGGAISF